jgi:hypothetical protein
MELRGTGETGTNILSPDVAVLPEAEGLLLWRTASSTHVGIQRAKDWRYWSLNARVVCWSSCYKCALRAGGKSHCFVCSTVGRGLRRSSFILLAHLVRLGRRVSSSPTIVQRSVISQWIKRIYHHTGVCQTTSPNISARLLQRQKATKPLN